MDLFIIWVLFMISVLFLFVVWVLPVMLSYRWAKEYGRSQGLWSTLAFFFGWIAAFVLLAVGKK